MPGRHHGAVICFLVLIAGVGFASQDAHAAVPRNFFGVAANVYPSASDFQRISRGGVRTVRCLFSWPAVEQSPGVRDWQQLDSVVESAAESNTQLLPLLNGTPLWASAEAANPKAYTPSGPPIYTPQGRAGWVAFVGDLARRYGTTGTFWALHPELPRVPIHSWQIWNEVNLPFFWGGKPSPRGYADLLRLSRGALSEADPSAQVILAGLLPYQSIVTGTVSGGRYLKRLYRVKGVRKLFDAVAIHPYGIKPRGVVGELRLMRKVLNSVGARRVPIWATEFGWTTGGVDFRRSPFRTTPAQQARRVSKTYRLLEKQAGRLRLKKAFYFSLADIGASGSWQAHMGLFDSSGVPKPAWYAYARAAGGQP
jgi:hypothetical protein